MTDSLSYIMIRVIKKHFHAMFSLLTDKEVYPGQPPLLRALIEQDGQSQRELAQRLNNKAATVTVMLKRMEKSGMVERRPDPSDQRVTRVYLTAKGRAAHEEVKKAMTVMEEACFSNFTEEEKAILRKLLLQVADNLQNEPFSR